MLLNRKSLSSRREVADSKAAFLYIKPKNYSVPGRRCRNTFHHIQVNPNVVTYSQKLDSTHKSLCFRTFLVCLIKITAIFRNNIKTEIAFMITKK